MGRKRRYAKRRKGKRGRGLPYVYNNKIYLGKKPQTGSGALWELLASLRANVGDVIGI